MLKIILNKDGKSSSVKTVYEKSPRAPKTPDNSPVITQNKQNRPRLFSRDVNPNSVSCSPKSY